VNALLNAVKVHVNECLLGIYACCQIIKISTNVHYLLDQKHLNRAANNLGVILATPAQPWRDTLQEFVLSVPDNDHTLVRVGDAVTAGG
jgi:hypothetical protein